MKSIGIVGYGLRNIKSITNAFTFLDFKHIITSDARLLGNSDGIILLDKNTIATQFHL